MKYFAGNDPENLRACAGFNLPWIAVILSGILFGWKKTVVLKFCFQLERPHHAQMCPVTRPFPHILRDCENRKEFLDYEISFCAC